MKQIFESEHIRYVEVSESLIKDYLVMVNDNENVNRYLGMQNAQYTWEQETAWVRKKLAEKAIVFSMLDKKSDAFIGNIELFGSDDTVKELGIAITAAQQNRTYGTEAVKAMTDYGFRILNLQKIVLRTDPENVRAIHVYEKCGFREYSRDDEDVYMELLRAE